MLSIVTDIQSMQINKNLTTATNAVNTALQRMSTGYKVNNAADDAAGLFLSSTMTAQLRGSQQAIKNISDGISLLQTADGALSNMTDILARLRDLSVQSANGVYYEKSREAFQREADALTAQLKQILEGTSFNGKTLLQTSENPTLASTLTLSRGGNPNNLTRASFCVIDPNQTASSQIPKSTTPPVLKNTTSTTSTTPETQSENTISGSVDFASGETKTVDIDGIKFTVRNKQSSAQSFSYTKDTDTGKISFTCSNFEISVVDKNISYDISLDGTSNTLRTGDMADNIEVITKGSANYIYGGKGNDTMTSGSSHSYFYGEDGDDIFNIMQNNTYAFGGNGNDTFNVSGNILHLWGGTGDDIFTGTTSNSTLRAEAGNDTISISGDDNQLEGGDDDDNITLSSGWNNIINGGSGTNTCVDNGTNTIRVNVSDANAQVFELAASEIVDATINGIKYTIENISTGDKVIYACVNDDGAIEFSGDDDVKITGEENKQHNVIINTNNVTFIGGNLDDRVVLKGDGYNSTVMGGAGNDTIENNALHNYIYGEDGDDVIYYQSSDARIISGGNGNDTFYLQTGKDLHVQGDAGDDTFVISDAVDTSSVAIIGGEGNNTITGKTEGLVTSGFAGSLYLAEQATIHIISMAEESPTHPATTYTTYTQTTEQ